MIKIKNLFGIQSIKKYIKRIKPFNPSVYVITNTQKQPLSNHSIEATIELYISDTGKKPWHFS